MRPTKTRTRIEQAGIGPVHLARLAGGVVGAVALGAVASAMVLVFLFYPVGNRYLDGAAVVTIPQGASAADIAERLASARVIRHPWVFLLTSRALGFDRHLKPGDYRLSRGLDLLAIMRQIRRGDVITVSVTIPEGYTLERIAALLAEKGLVGRERFIAVASDDRLAYGPQFPVDKKSRSLEGFLFPDTYRFVPGRPEEEIVRRLVGRFFQAAYPILVEGADRTGRGVNETLILASIIEKEAVLDWERPLIASVFYNRLARGMPLQSDPTVQYVLSGGPAPLTYADLAIDSPFNTYRYPGLPPQPIASPGLASIRAAIGPAETPYLYFVARGDGSHVFSRTYTEHLQAMASIGR